MFTKIYLNIIYGFQIISSKDSSQYYNVIVILSIYQFAVNLERKYNHQTIQLINIFIYVHIYINMYFEIVYHSSRQFYSEKNLTNWFMALNQSFKFTVLSK